jgi:ATP-dependent Clp endopeptidase proteolytic subunit ClpP
MSSYYNHSAKDVLLTIEKTENAEEPEKVPKANPIDKDNQKITKVNNHIYFYSEVTRNSIFALTTLIREVEQDNLALANTLCIDPIPIYLHISSFGGSVFAAFTAIDVILACQVDIITVIDGASASAGTLMSVVGKKRYMRPNSYMLVHQLSAGAWGKMCELEDAFTNNKRLMDQIKTIYKEHSNIPKKELNEILKHDLWWDADTCLKYGLVDDLWTKV